MKKRRRVLSGFLLLGFLIITTCSLEGDIEAQRQKPIPVTIPAPGAPVVTASDRMITICWTAVDEAERYEVFVGTALEPPGSPIKTISAPTTTTIVDNLTNKTVYYIWIKAVNRSGSSDFSPRGRGIPWPPNEIPATPERPTIIPGINLLTVNWDECGGAAFYEVYKNTAPSTPSTPEITTDKTSAVIKNLENGVIYYIWVRAVNSAGKSAYSPVESGISKVPAIAPAVPARPVLTAGNRELTVSWQAVELAAAYEIWLETSDNVGQAVKQGGDITDGITETIITGLQNETVYYVWIKAKNVIGTSGFSPSATAKPTAFAVVPQAPATPAVTAGNSELRVSWQPVEGALSYEVWTGLSNNPANAEKHGSDVSGTSLTLTGLVNGTTYYIWVKAKNNIGTSGLSSQASGTPINTPTPTLSAGNGQLLVTWTAVAGADQYEVFCGTSINPPQTATQTINAPAVSATISGLVNGTTYNVWIRGKNSTGTGAMSSPVSGKPIGNMGTVTLVSGNGQLSASWSAVAGADQYEVYYNTTNTIPGSPSQTVSTTTATISSLTNGTTYYVWVKGKNANGTGGANSAVNGKPLGTPGAPTVSPAYKQLLVTWTAVAGADEYEVYYGISTPTILATTATGTTATITGLTNGTTYYIRLRAKNANGISGYGPNVNQAPDGTPGLYRDAAKIGTQNLADSLTYISTNAVSGDDYYIVLGTNEAFSPRTLNYSNKTVGITLLGFGGEKTITLNANGSLFTINAGVTFILDENITLVGRNTNDVSLVSIQTGGNLILNAGSKITNNTATSSLSGGGVYVNGGTFTMNGGEISGNTTYSILLAGGGGGGVYVSGGIFTMNGGEISGNTGSCSYSSGGGGGVCVNGGTFTMSGGEISGNTGGNTGSTSGGGGGGGVYVNGGTFTMSGGEISGNTASSNSGGGFGGGVCVIGTFIMSGGEISGNTASSYGGGVYVNTYNGTFTKTGGGTITGFASDTVNGNVVKNSSGVVQNNSGHAVYVNSSPVKRRESTAGPGAYLDSSKTAAQGGGWE